MKRLFFLLCFFLTSGLHAQSVDEEIAAVEKAINSDSLIQARELLDRYMRKYLQKEDYLNLAYFIPQAGFLANKEEGVDVGISQVEYWVNLLAQRSADPRVLRQAHLESHTFYMYAGKVQRAYDVNATALEFTYKISDHTPSEWAMVERNLGVIANHLGNPDRATQHTLKALEGFDQDPDTSPEDRFNILNDLGVRYWYAAKWDSAAYFWHEGIRFLDQMEKTPTNMYYRRAMIEGNLAAVYDIKGNLEESIRMVKASIANQKHFIDTALDDPKRNRAFISIFYSSMNLGLVYKSMGNYQQALAIHEYALREKEKHLPPGHPEIAESLILVGQSHNSLLNNGEAKRHLARALELLEQAEGTFHSQMADIHYSLALVHEREENPTEAKNHYLTARRYYELANNQTLDFVYLGFLAQAAEFFARSGEEKLALELSKQSFDYIRGVDGLQSLPGFEQIVYRGRVLYTLGRYKEAMALADQGSGVLDRLLMEAGNSTDSVRITYEKPRAILLRSKSNYQLADTKTETFLLEILAELRKAETLLDERKVLLTDSEDLAVLLSQNMELAEFTKQILLELYRLTGSDRYLVDLMSTHESSVYSRIRIQLNQQRQMRFAGVPDALMQEEVQLKEQLAFQLSEGGDMEEFLRLSVEWKDLQKRFQTDYPQYYQTRYGSIKFNDFSGLGTGQVVRYLFVENELKALVINGGKPKLINLDFDPGLIERIPKVWHDANKLGEVTHSLYQQLWEPFARQIDREHVVVIPDGLLFNLSFDLLTDRPIQGFGDFSRYSLLATRNVTYQYSLWQMQDRYPHVGLGSNYVGFAPGFLDKMKSKYMNSLRDSLELDRAYLTLLPQPFTVRLTSRAATLFGGESFLYEQSTPTVFKERAGRNKIIHIGTHAESNNISPAFSRLIFAKADVPDEDNSLYAYEIYDTDLTAHLAVLTACETGKPVYKPGEGMISLAHAFQYAGSESLLTSLWKLDEKATIEITDYFLAYLAEGVPKDRALRLAKLRYLSTATGRTLAPSYWAGLVLWGDPSPIPLEKKVMWRWWILTVVLLSGCFLAWRRFRAKRQPA